MLRLGAVPVFHKGGVMRRKLAATLSIVVALSGLGPAAAAREGSKFRPLVKSDRGIVATESRPAARVGVGVLRDGGVCARVGGHTVDFVAVRG